MPREPNPMADSLAIVLREKAFAQALYERLKHSRERYDQNEKREAAYVSASFRLFRF